MLSQFRVVQFDASMRDGYNHSILTEKVYLLDNGAVKVSTRGEYGIRALLELAQRHGEGYIKSTDIAEARGIPENYLYQLLITLRKSGFIRSRRGPQGGHMLARSPGRISLAAVLIALEGPIEPVACIQEGLTDDCAFTKECPVREVWQRATDATREILESATFADLTHREQELRAIALST
jgi:Rrf2 family protein